MAHFIFYATDAFDDIWRRRQHLSTALAALGHTVDYLEPALRLGSIVKKEPDTSLIRQPYGRQETHGVMVHRTFHPFPWIGRPFWYGLNLKLDTRFITRLIQQPGPTTVLWLTNPLHGPLAATFQKKVQVVADLTDRWSAFDANAHWADYLELNQRRLVREATSVCAVSPALAAFAKDTDASKEPHLLPNGVTQKILDPLQTPEWFSKLDAPKAFYAGTLEDRVQFDLIGQLAAAYPAVQFILAGPVATNQQAMKTLFAMENVHHAGPKPHTEVLGAMQAANVLLLPHRLDALTESMHPLKLLEYLASGNPILASAVHGVTEVADLVGVYHDSAQAINLFSELLAENNPDARTKRRQFASAHTWEQRAKDLLLWLKL